MSLLPLLLPGLADLHQEFPILRELQDHVVVAKAPGWLSSRRGFAGSRPWRMAVGPSAVAADPDVAFVVDRDPWFESGQS